MQPNAIYLRKSRKDLDAEAAGQPDTLKRHRRQLVELAKARHLPVAEIYEEVVSGDSIAARPEMQKLLAAVEQGAFAGVLVVEVERLARGDTIDQGIVAQTFKYSNTKIITPEKTYDPENEYDEEYFEFGLFMSRREYKTINRRLQRGRIASMREGKFVGNKTPYGYTRERLEHDRGFKLVPMEDEAQVVRNIFSWYIGEDGTRIGTSLIARKLQDMGIPSPTGGDWLVGTVRNILANQTYAGWLRWGNRGAVKKVVNGVVQLSRPRKKVEDVQLFKGLHTPLVTQEQFDQAQSYLNTNKSRPGPKQVKTTNPLAGLVYCDQCGRSMIRRPFGSGRPSAIICNYTACSTVGCDLDVLEAAILDGLQMWLREFDLNYEATEAPRRAADITLAQNALAATERELRQLAARESKAYELVETGVYTTEVFLARTAALSAEKTELLELRDQQASALENIKHEELARKSLAPNVRYVLETYPLAQTPEEKNLLLKSVLSKVIYHKTQRLRSKAGSDMQISLVPIIPDLQENSY